MNESPRIQNPDRKKVSQLLRHSMSIALMGVLSSCTLQKPMSTDNLVEYPNTSDMLRKPFIPEMSQVNPDIQNLSNYFLQSSQQV
jgi:hypothetical protein